MSEILLASIPEIAVHEQIAEALAAGCEHDEFASIASLEASFGPVVQQIVALIKAGLKNLPEILAALSALGIVLPPWFSLIINILLRIVPAA